MPDKPRAIADIFRVLRPGGFVHDIVMGKPMIERSRANPRLWAECVVGASIEDDYLGMFREVGFEDVEVLRSFDYFAASSNDDTAALPARSAPGRSKSGCQNHGDEQAQAGLRAVLAASLTAWWQSDREDRAGAAWVLIDIHPAFL